MPDISIIIVNFNTIDYLRECLTSIFLHTSSAVEVIVVDNASSDNSVEMVRSTFPQVRLICSEQNLGFGVANNLGAHIARGKYVFLFNSDAYLTTDTPNILACYMERHPEVSCICPRVILPGTGKIQPRTFGFNPTLRHLFMQSTGLNLLFPKYSLFFGVDGIDRWATAMEVDWVSGVCMCIRRDDYLKVEGFNPKFFMYCEDIELCIKLQKLGKIILYDDASIVHYGGASSKSLPSKIRNAVLQQRHLLMIIDDHYGSLHGHIARLLLLGGGIIRLLACVLLTPRKGWGSNELRQTCWARVLDLLSISTYNRKTP